MIIVALRGLIPSQNHEMTVQHFRLRGLHERRLGHTGQRKLVSLQE